MTLSWKDLLIVGVFSENAAFLMGRSNSICEEYGFVTGLLPKGELNTRDIHKVLCTCINLLQEGLSQV